MKSTGTKRLRETTITTLTDLIRRIENKEVYVKELKSERSVEEYTFTGIVTRVLGKDVLLTIRYTEK
jgi:hypothetical protein